MAFARRIRLQYQCLRSANLPPHGPAIAGSSLVAFAHGLLRRLPPVRRRDLPATIRSDHTAPTSRGVYFEILEGASGFVADGPLLRL